MAGDNGIGPEPTTRGGSSSQRGCCQEILSGGEDLVPVWIVRVESVDDGLEFRRSPFTQRGDAGGDPVVIVRLVEANEHAHEEVEQVGIVGIPAAEIFELEFSSNDSLRVGAEEIRLVGDHLVEGCDLIADVLSKGKTSNTHQFCDLVRNDGVVASVTFELPECVQY